MSSSLAADAAFDFSFPPCGPATPPQPASTSYTYEPSALLDIPYANYFAPSVHHHGGHTRSSSQCSAVSATSGISAYSFASAPSAPSDVFLSAPSSRQGTPAPVAAASASTPATTTATATTAATTAAATAASRRARSPIRTHGPLLLPKIRAQDQALGPDDNGPLGSRSLSPPKRARTATALAPATPAPRSRSASAHSRHNRRHSSLLSAVSGSSPYAMATAAATPSRHVRSATNPDNALLYASSSASASFDSSPPPPQPPTLLCEPVRFDYQPHQPAAQQHLQQQHDAAKDGEDYDYGFVAPYPGTVPTAYLSSADLTALANAGLLAPGQQHHHHHLDNGYLYHPLQHLQPLQHHPHQQAMYTATPRESSPLSVASSVASSVAGGTPEPTPPPLAVSVPMPVSSSHHAGVPVITETPPSATVQTPPPPPPAMPISAPAPATTTTSLLAHLTSPNPAPALVRTISFPLRDPSTKHYWWDVRQVRPWAAFTAAGLAALPGARDVLSCPVPASLLQASPVLPAAAHQWPETEADLHGLYAGHYLPRVNAALALSSARPVQLSSTTTASSGDTVFVGRANSDNAAAAAALFGGGGRSGARVVGVVKSFDRFNTGMRAEGNVKRVEYLRGLAHVHHLMREHSCRYGFVLTEIELVVVRNGIEATPQFGQLEVASVPLAAAGVASKAHEEEEEESESDRDAALAATPLTACLALWGLCMLASDEMAAAAAAAAAGPSSSSLLCPYNTHIGAPAEGTRHKAAPRDAWMPQPQLAEKRTAKRARGWVMPEDAVGRKEMGRRGVRYGAW